MNVINVKNIHNIGKKYIFQNLITLKTIIKKKTNHWNYFYSFNIHQLTNFIFGFNMSLIKTTWNIFHYVFIYCTLKSFLAQVLLRGSQFEQLILYFILECLHTIITNCSIVLECLTLKSSWSISINPWAAVWTFLKMYFKRMVAFFSIYFFVELWTLFWAPVSAWGHTLNKF